MKRGVLLAAVTVALLVIVGGSAAYAQDVANFNVPFKFNVGKSILNPGKYQVMVSSDQATITLTPERGNATVTPAITRLAQHVVMSDAKLVFDKVGEQYALSEVWLPVEDGYLVHDTKAPHKHHIVTAEPKKK
jgi:hypothetical protein